MTNMRRASNLLPMLLGLLAARGLAPEALDPWRAWVIFKHYARVVDETPVFDDPPATATEADFWTFDCSTFARFVDRVEGHAGFADLIARRPAASMVYWEDA